MKDNELRGLILEKLYETRHQQKLINVTKEKDPFNDITNSFDVTVAILRHLNEDGLIDYNASGTGSGYIWFVSCRINAHGIDIVEGTKISNISIAINNSTVSLQQGNNNVINNNISTDEKDTNKP